MIMAIGYLLLAAGCWLLICNRLAIFAHIKDLELLNLDKRCIQY